MAQRIASNGVQPAPPDAPTPPAGQPETAKSEAEARHRRISEAAYHRAQRRDFEPGKDQDDWFEAEQEIDRNTR
jgi:Protein of unknown function (DUF2934)